LYGDFRSVKLEKDMVKTSLKSMLISTRFSITNIFLP